MKTFLTTLAVAAVISFPALAEGDTDGSQADDAKIGVKASSNTPAYDSAIFALPPDLRAGAMAQGSARLQSGAKGGSGESAAGAADTGVSGGAGASGGGADANAGGSAGTGSD